jgi:predicted enzyme related to lactoylglutathione lyase
MPEFQSPTTPLIIAATIDCNDLEAMTAFWSSLLGVESTVHEPFGFLAHAVDRKVTIWLQQVSEERAGKNRVHLDFAVPDLDATLARIEELGGRAGERHEWQGFVWNMCYDPEGNVFDVMQAQAPPDEPSS